MTGLRLQNVDMLHLLWLIPAMIAVIVYAAQRRQAAIKRFIDSGLLGKVAISTRPRRRALKADMVLLAMAFIVLALSRPGWNPKPQTVERRGRDVVFLIDVSRSMLAEDLAPNRLERAKLAIRDCVARLQGDRVALVAFAGTAAVKCRLTLDYGFFRMILDTVGVDNVARGGTMIGDALRKALDDVFDDQEKKYKDVILITDGEDHDSFPIDAAKAVGERGIRIIAIGLGDESDGRRIPVVDEQGRRSFLQYRDREVWSKLDADTLRKMVNVTPGGKYLNVATGAIDLGNVYMQLVAAAEKKDLESQTIERYEEKFQLFMTVALLLLGIEMVLRETAKERSGHA